MATRSTAKRVDEEEVFTIETRPTKRSRRTKAPHAAGCSEGDPVVLLSDSDDEAVVIRRVHKHDDGVVLNLSCGKIENDPAGNQARFKASMFEVDRQNGSPCITAYVDVFKIEVRSTTQEEATLLITMGRRKRIRLEVTQWSRSQEERVRGLWRAHPTMAQCLEQDDLRRRVAREEDDPHGGPAPSSLLAHAPCVSHIKCLCPTTLVNE